MMTEIATYRGPFWKSLKQRFDCGEPKCGKTHLCRRCFYYSTGCLPETVGI